MSVEEEEIERKYLVNLLPDLSLAHKTVIRQGYITRPDDSVEVRLRQKAEKYFLTVKSGDGLVRGEIEIEIAQTQFEALWPNTQGRRIEKERWTGSLTDKLQYELDVFQAALTSLMLVEVEFDSTQQADSFQPPRWFGSEVTFDKHYKNKSLATNPQLIEPG